MPAPGRRYLFVNHDSTAGRLEAAGVPRHLDDPRVARLFPKAYSDIAAEDPRNFVGEIVDSGPETISAVDLRSGALRIVERDDYALTADESTTCDQDFVRRSLASELWARLDARGREVLRQVMPGAVADVEEIARLRALMS